MSEGGEVSGEKESSRPNSGGDIELDVDQYADDDAPRSRPQSQSQSRAQQMLDAIRKKEEDAKKEVRLRMEKGLRQLLGYHNPVELSSICGLLHLPVQERGHISLQQVLDYAIVNGNVKGDRLKKVLECCWEEPLVQYIRSELNPHFHRAKDPATVVMHWWKEGGLVSDQKIFNPHFVSREVKKVGVGYEDVTSPDILARLDELRAEQEIMKNAERLMFHVQNYESIHNYFESMRSLRQHEVKLREWLISEVEITRVRLDVVDEAVHYSLKCEKDCEQLTRDVTSTLMNRLSRDESYGYDLLNARHSHQNNLVVLNAYLRRLIDGCEAFHSPFPSAPFDVPDNESQLSTALRRFMKALRLYKQIKDDDCSNHIERRAQNRAELARLMNVQERLEKRLSFLKSKAFWEEQRLDAERLALRKMLADDARRVALNEATRQEAWGTTLDMAARACESNKRRRDLYPILRQGLLGTSKLVHQWCNDVDDVFEVLTQDCREEIARNKEMEKEEEDMRKYMKELAAKEKKARLAKKKKEAAAAAKKKKKEASDSGSKSGKSAASSKKSAKSKGSKSEGGKKAKKGEGKKKGKGDGKKKGKAKSKDKDVGDEGSVESAGSKGSKATAKSGKSKGAKKKKK